VATGSATSTIPAPETLFDDLLERGLGLDAAVRLRLKMLMERADLVVRYRWQDPEGDR
jgi:hypothetical protein